MKNFTQQHLGVDLKFNPPKSDLGLKHARCICTHGVDPDHIHNINYAHQTCTYVDLVSEFWCLMVEESDVSEGFAP